MPALHQTKRLINEQRLCQCYRMTAFHCFKPKSLSAVVADQLAQVNPHNMMRWPSNIFIFMK